MPRGKRAGLFWELNPGPLGPRPRIMPLDQTASAERQVHSSIMCASDFAWRHKGKLSIHKVSSLNRHRDIADGCAHFRAHCTRISHTAATQFHVESAGCEECQFGQDMGTSALPLHMAFGSSEYIIRCAFFICMMDRQGVLLEINGAFISLKANTVPVRSCKP